MQGRLGCVLGLLVSSLALARQQASAAVESAASGCALRSSTRPHRRQLRWHLRNTRLHPAQQYAPAPQAAPPQQYAAPAAAAQVAPAQYAPPQQQVAPAPQAAPPQQYAAPPQQYAPSQQQVAPVPQAAPASAIRGAAQQYAPAPQAAPPQQYARPPSSTPAAAATRRPPPGRSGGSAAPPPLPPRSRRSLPRRSPGAHRPRSTRLPAAGSPSTAGPAPVQQVAPPAAAELRSRAPRAGRTGRRRAAPATRPLRPSRCCRRSRSRPAGALGRPRDAVGGHATGQGGPGGPPAAGLAAEVYYRDMLRVRPHKTDVFTQNGARQLSASSFTGCGPR
jgi:hypothetical protein